MRSLIIILFVNNKIHLNNAFFLRLDYEQNQINEFKNITNYNSSQIIKLIKENNITDYHLLNFEDLLCKKLNENPKVDNLEETQKKFNELIIKKDSEITSNDIIKNEDYLRKKLTEKNQKFKDLLRF